MLWYELRLYNSIFLPEARDLSFSFLSYLTYQLMDAAGQYVSSFEGEV
jgi:hypothetical protein